MSVEEMKKQIVEKVEIMDEKSLQEILNIISSMVRRMKQH